MKELIATIARALVDQPEQVSVAEIKGSHSSVLELKVAKSDMANRKFRHCRRRMG